MPLSPIDQRIATSLEIHQHEALLRVEGIADRAEREIQRLAREAIGIITDDAPVQVRTHDAADVFRRMAPAAKGIMDEQFRRLLHWSYRETVHDLARSIPRRWFRAVDPIVLLVGEELIDLPPVAFADTPEPVVGERMSEEQWEAFLTEHIFPPPTREHVERVLYRDVAGANWQQRMDALSHKITDFDKLAGVLSSGATQGLTRQQLVRQVQPHVQGIASSARRMARTEGLRIVTAIQKEQTDQLGDMLQGYQIVATLDQNTRPEHALRNGRVYWADRRRRPTVDELPELPDEPNCRCYSVPVLKPPAEFENDPQLRTEFQNAAGDSIPDPIVYSQWFDNVDPGRRKMAVGVKRYESMRRQLGSTREPRFTDFIDGDGKLMTVQALRAETAQQRERRLRRVDTMITQREALLGQVSRFGFISKKMDESATIPEFPKRFQRADAPREWSGKIPHQKRLEAQQEKLTTEQRDVLSDYTLFEKGKTADWQAVNSKLRNFIPLTHEEQAAQDTIREAIRNSPPLPEGITTYRGINVPEEIAESLIKDFLSLADSGAPHMEHSNTSSSVNPDRAVSSRIPKGEVRIVYEFKPKRGIYLQTITQQEADFEVLMSDEARYTVVRVVPDVLYGSGRVTVVQLQEL